MTVAGHLDLVLKENKKMKERIEDLDKENSELKRVVAELSRLVGRKVRNKHATEGSH